MNNLMPVFSSRDYSNRLVDPSLNWSVNSYRWHALGGPVDATISATGTVLGLWTLLDYLRCPVTIRDENNTDCWWGYVHAVEIQQGGIRFGASLKRMANKVRVKYSFIAPGSQMAGETKNTAAASDTDSIAEYGTKELLQSISGASDAQALQIRDTLLAQRKYPIPTVDFADGEDRAILTCQGWYDTLGWQYYANSGTSDVATTTQIAAIVTAAGQFLTATDIDNASGVTSPEFRDGNTTALREIQDLLESGTTNKRRLLASVDAGRRLRVYEEPARPSVAPYLIASDGSFRTPVGVLLEPHLAGMLVTGNWAALQDVLPASVDLTRLADPSMLFIEEAVWSRNRLIPKVRDVAGYMELGGL